MGRPPHLLRGNGAAGDGAHAGAARPSPGQAILDLAAGTGVVGFAAAGLVGPGGRVIVRDFSEAMVDAAERHASKLGLENVECRLLDAERLDLPDDAVEGGSSAGGDTC